jgi:hypothetical protein
MRGGVAHEEGTMRRFLFLAALVAALSFPAAVAADTTDGQFDEPRPAESTGGMTLAVGQVRLTARLVATADVTVTCQPKPPNEYPISSYWEDYAMTFSVKQASGRSIAFGQAAVPFDPNVTCDGLPHILSASVSADPAGIAFKNGSAVVAVDGFARSFSYNSETGESGYHMGRASTGWISMRFGR